MRIIIARCRRSLFLVDLYAFWCEDAIIYLTMNNKNILEIPGSNNKSPIRVNYYWLRDHCRCEKCYDKSTSQRKFNFMEISLDIKPKTYEIIEDKLLKVVCK